MSRRVEQLSLLGASLVSGLGALAFILIAKQGLGLQEFAPISQLWTVWAISAAVLTFSSVQMTVRRFAVSDRSNPSPLARYLPAGLLLLTLVPVTVVFRQRLFGSGSWAWPTVAALVPLGATMTGVARGRLAAVGRTGRLALAVAGENVVRCGLGFVCLVVASPPIAYAGAILAGFVVALLGIGSGHSPRWYGVQSAARHRHRLLPTATAIAGLCIHGLLVIAPSVVALRLGSAETISALFILLAIYRAPYQLVMGYTPRVAVSMLRPRADAYPGRLNGPITLIGAVVVGYLIVGSTGALVGERIISDIVGVSGHLSSLDHFLAAGLPIVAIAALLLTMQHVATISVPRILIVWLSVSLFSVVLLMTLDPTVSHSLSVLSGAMWVAVLGLCLGVGNPTIEPGLRPSAIGLGLATAQRPTALGEDPASSELDIESRISTGIGFRSMLSLVGTKSLLLIRSRTLWLRALGRRSAEKVGVLN